MLKFWAYKLSFVVDFWPFLFWILFRQPFEKIGKFFKIFWSPCLPNSNGLKRDKLHGQTLAEMTNYWPSFQL
jgi:hypothetical protein